MSDSGVREIQLSGKHVFFLFMAGVVAAVAIFLLGVSVGRGVAKPESAEAQLAPLPAESEAAAPADLPPPTTPAQGELQYDALLQGKSSAKPSVAPAASATPAASPAAPPARPSPKPAAPAGTLYVQANSFSSRANANREVSQLKAKGITAQVVDVPGGGARYKVRIGPFDQTAADAMLARLRKEGYKPSLIR
jgi:DedD protein